MEPTLTIRPSPARIGSSSAWVTASSPKTLTSYWRRTRSIGTPSSGPATAIPALLTSPASGAPRTRAARLAICPASVTSTSTGSMRASCARRSAPSSSRRTPARTAKPARASRRAVARPMPVDAPVTTTVPELGMERTLLGGGLAQAVLRPRLVGEQLGEVHRRGDVDQHSGREEALELRGVGAAELAHELVELGVAPADDLAHLVVAAGRIALQLHQQQRAIGHEVGVGRAHRGQRALVAGVGGRGAKRLPDALAAALDGGQEEPRLGADEAERVGLRDPDVVGDRAHGRAVQARLGEVLDGGLHERLAALGGGLAGPGRCLRGHGLTGYLVTANFTTS